MRLRALILAAASALIVAVGALGATKTTEPSRHILIVILIRDTGMLLGAQQATLHHGDMIPLAGPVPRGDFLSINIFNRSKTHQRLTILGKKTPVIKPGGTAHLFVVAVARGTFVYKATSAKRTFRGFLTVA